MSYCPFAYDAILYHHITSDLESIQLQKDIDNFLEWSQLWLLNIRITTNARA